MLIAAKLYYIEHHRSFHCTHVHAHASHYRMTGWLWSLNMRKMFLTGVPVSTRINSLSATSEMSRYKRKCQSSFFTSLVHIPSLLSAFSMFHTEKNKQKNWKTGSGLWTRLHLYYILFHYFLTHSLSCACINSLTVVLWRTFPLTWAPSQATQGREKTRRYSTVLSLSWVPVSSTTVTWCRRTSAPLSVLKTATCAQIECIMWSSFPCLQEFRQIEVKGFDASLFQTNQVFYSSKDGTKIPMFIVHRKVRPVLAYCITIM